jgi:hypothetical protein
VYPQDCLWPTSAPPTRDQRSSGCFVEGPARAGQSREHRCQRSHLELQVDATPERRLHIGDHPRPLADLFEHDLGTLALQINASGRRPTVHVIM